MMIKRVVVGAALVGLAARMWGADPQRLNIVFVGDSITYGYLLTAPAEEAPPARAAAFLEGMPCFSSVRFTNCGRNAYRTDQFLPESPESAWPQVTQAGDSYTNDTGLLLFSIMLGANDSVTATPAQYESHLTALVNALLARYPASQIVLHHPLWYTKVSSTHPEVLQQFIPVIDALVGAYGQTHPGQVHLGDIKGWDYFERNHQSICFQEARDNVPYYIHPNVVGATSLGQYWADAIYRALAGVVAYWDFGSDGSGVADASGYGHTLTNSGVTLLGGAAVFSGTQTVFSTANTLDLQAYTQLTVEYYIRTASPSNSLVLEHSANTTLYSGAFCSALGEGNMPGLLTGAIKTAQENGYNIEATAAGAASDDTWHHVALVIDASKAGADRAQLYFDKVRQATYANFTNDAATALRSETLYIGSRANSSHRFTGWLDDVRISKQALSTNQFLQARTTNEYFQSATSVLPQPALAYWPFESGRELVDATGNGNTLTNQGVTFRGGTAVFSGTQTAFSTAGTLDLRACTNLTVEYFVRAPAASGCIVFEHTEICNDNPGGFLSSLGDLVGPGTVAAALRTSAAGSYNIEATAAGAASDGQWHHVALVIDSSKDGADRVQLYFDNVRQAKLWGLSDASVTPFLNATFYIGSRANTGSKFAGRLDDVRITGQALSVGEFLQAPTLSSEVAYWPFTPGAETDDATGNGNTLTNSGVAFAKGFAAFGGTQAVFSTAGSLDLRWYPAVTVECFIRAPAASGGVVFEHTPVCNDNPGGFLAESGLNGGPGSVSGALRTAASYNIEITPDGAASDGQWHHVAMVIDPSKDGGDRLQLYFDCVRQAKLWGLSDAAVTPFLNATFYIGSRANAVSKFAGQLDDVRITGRALAVDGFMTRRSAIMGTTVFAR